MIGNGIQPFDKTRDKFVDGSRHPF